MDRHYTDDDRDYIFDNNYFDYDPLDESCPFGICIGSSTGHAFCEFVLQRRIERYTEESDSQTPEWIEAFEKKWKFWLHLHPTSMKGDIKVAPTQRLRSSARKFFAE